MAPTWRNMCIELKESDAPVLVQCMNAFNASKSQAMFCTLCATPTPHLMRYKLLNCRCTQSKQAAPYASCPWRGKMLVCPDRKVVSLFESGAHVTNAKPPHSPNLTTAQKEYAKQVAKAGMKPARIRIAMLLQFALRPSDLPALQKVQNVVCYYRRTKLGGSDTISNIAAVIRAQAFSGAEQDHQPFTFGWDVDANGALVVGSGSDEKPFLVGFSTKDLPRHAAEADSSFIFHVDTTFKTNQVGYPVLVCGISDAARSFHLLALFITSQQQEAHFPKAFASLRWVYSRAVGEPLRVSFVMGDADGAQYNAGAQVFGGDCSYAHLMCYYHLIAKVVERTKGMPKELGDSVLRDVYDMHYSRNSEEFNQIRKAAQLCWQGNPVLKPFHTYFKRVWLNERFCRWQCFQTPPGYATTNNPVEQFNRALKRDYTAHRLLKLGELMLQLGACCRQCAIDVRPFSVKPVASKELLAQVKALQAQERLREHVFSRLSLDFHLQDESTDVLHVMYTPPIRTYNPATNKMQEDIQVSAQISTNSARMESENQPATGWPVDMVTQTCPCSYHWKYTSCVHLLFALQTRARIDGNGEEVMFNRRVQKRKRPGVGPAPTSAGRPPRVGPALERE